MTRVTMAMSMAMDMARQSFEPARQSFQSRVPPTHWAHPCTATRDRERTLDNYGAQCRRHSYRNEVPQHQHHDPPSNPVGCRGLQPN